MTFDLTSLAIAIKSIALIFSTVVISYSGFVLATTTNVQQRNEWKEVIAGVTIGLILLFLAPLIAAYFTGGTYCR